MAVWLKVCGSTVVLMAMWPAAAEAEPLLPDLFAWASTEKIYMRDGQFDTSTGRALYRFSVAIPNIGFGPFEVYEVTDTVNDIQHVYQWIENEDNPLGYDEHLMGSFENPEPAFGHLFLVGLAQYNLRTVTAGNGVGPVVSSHDKTSFGLVDSVAYALQIPGAPQSRVYTTALENPVGVSIGWADLYGRNLPGQWVDASGLASGQYWLEVVIDPYGYVQELDDNNNTTQVLVNLMVPQVPGDYDGNGTVGPGDYALWRDSLGQVGAGLAADGNADNMITQADYAYWLERFGNTYGSEAAAAGSAAGSSLAVPEPAGWQLAIFMLGGVLGLRRVVRRSLTPTSRMLT